jgi:hypothetical protein
LGINRLQYACSRKGFVTEKDFASSRSPTPVSRDRAFNFERQLKAEAKMRTYYPTGSIEKSLGFDGFAIGLFRAALTTNVIRIK